MMASEASHRLLDDIDGARSQHVNPNKEFIAPRSLRSSSNSDTKQNRNSVDSVNSLTTDDDLRVESDLPPIDRGAGAWGFLFGIWLLEAMLWGFPLSFGIFQSHYTNHPLFASQASLIPSIGSSSIGLAYFLCVFVTPICLAIPTYRLNLIVFLGFALCLAGLLIASFATHAWHLVLGQGVVYGVGWVVCYTPFLLLLNEWFEVKRGLAYGILFGASGVSGLIIPFALENLLAVYDFRVTLRIYVVATALIGGPGFWWIRPRLGRDWNENRKRRSLEEDGSGRRVREMGAPSTIRSSHMFVKKPVVYVFFVAILVQGLAFFVPNTFLPSYSHTLGLPSSHGSLLLAINSLCQVTGQIGLGYYSDKVSIHIPSAISALVSGVAVLVFWGPATGFLQLAIFAALWGGFAGSYSVLWTRIAAGLAETQGETMMLYGWFSLERGVASGLSGPISAILIADQETIGEYGLGRYRAIVIFSGCCLLISGLCGIAYFLDKEHGWRANRRNRTRMNETRAGA